MTSTIEMSWKVLTMLVSIHLVALLFGGIAVAQGPAECGDAQLDAETMSATEHTHYDKRILMLWGAFDGNAHQTVKRKIERRSSYDEIWMCSNGGRVDQGKLIGEELARAQATVRVPNGFQCVSSCTIAFVGGFARIIEPEANYLVHASSGFSDFSRLDQRNRKMIIECLSPGAAGVCEHLVDQAGRNGILCRNISDYENTRNGCLVFDARAQRQAPSLVGFRFRALDRLPVTQESLDLISQKFAVGQVDYAADLIEYYQRMLLSNNPPRGLNDEYDQLKRSFKPLSIYDPSNYGQDRRFLADDVRAINSFQTTGRYEIWQSILTNIELSVQRQMVQYIQDKGLSFGPASSDAVKIMESMLICQIQTVCKLEVIDAKALGIHNVMDAN